VPCFATQGRGLWQVYAGQGSVRSRHRSLRRCSQAPRPVRLSRCNIGSCAIYPPDMMASYYVYRGSIVPFPEVGPGYNYAVEMLEIKHDLAMQLSEFSTDSPESRATTANAVLVKNQAVCSSTSVVSEMAFERKNGLGMSRKWWKVFLKCENQTA
jgi:hypothetical protein